MEICLSLSSPPINASSIYIPNIQFQLENCCTVLLINTEAERGARICETKHAHKIMIGKLLEETLRARMDLIWEVNIRMDLKKKTDWAIGKGIKLPQVIFHSGNSVVTVINVEYHNDECIFTVLNPVTEGIPTQEFCCYCY